MVRYFLFSSNIWVHVCFWYSIRIKLLFAWLLTITVINVLSSVLDFICISKFIEFSSFFMYNKLNGQTLACNIKQLYMDKESCN